MCDAHRAVSEPSEWVRRHIDLARRGGVVLDVACGGGRHLMLAVGQGLRGVGVDRDVAAARARLDPARVDLIEADLEGGGGWPLGARRFDGVIVTNYLWRPLLPLIVGAVGAGGVLIYETFGIGQERIGRPRNPDFLLCPGELLDVARPALTVVAYEHRRLDAPDRIVQRIVAVGPSHPLGVLLAGRA